MHTGRPLGQGMFVGALVGPSCELCLRGPGLQEQHWDVESE